MPKAKNLKYLRTKAHLSQQDFADEIGVSKQTVLSWESRKRAIPVPSSKRIAQYFGIGYEEYCDIDMEIVDNEDAKGRVYLTETEKQSILMFRQLPDEIKKLIRYAIAVEHKLYGGDT